MESKNSIKHILHPLRTFLGRFVVVPDSQPQKPDEEKLFYKVGHFVASDMIEGDYLEFGVFKGYTFSQAFLLLKQAYQQSFTPSVWNSEQDCEQRLNAWKKMRFVAFDSFQGLPKPSGIDKLSSEFTEGKFSNSEADFLDYVMTKGVPRDKIEIVPGWFNETLNKATRDNLKLKRAAVIHVDSDLYESAKLVLDFVEPLLQDGTIIIFDDWYNFKGHPQLGEQKAFYEWLEKNPDWIATQYQKESVARNSFIMNKRIA